MFFPFKLASKRFVKNNLPVKCAKLLSLGGGLRKNAFTVDYLPQYFLKYCPSPSMQCWNWALQTRAWKIIVCDSQWFVSWSVSAIITTRPLSHLSVTRPAQGPAGNWLQTSRSMNQVLHVLLRKFLLRMSTVPPHPPDKYL